TDIATFESRAASDVVFVRYQGCELEVIDACADDAVPGRFGAYRPPKWTSGSVEHVNIEDSAQLYAKLPLGVATFGGEVERGVSLDLAYYVSGVATATRSAMYRDALRNNPACQKATHFVYAYNLGAFALSTLEKEKEGVTAQVADVGGGLESNRKRQAAKKSGELDACGGDSAADTDKCRVPIRLALRAIEAGANPGGDDAPPPPQAGEQESNLAMAEKLRKTAMDKAMAGDGKGCLEELRKADELDPDPTRSSETGKGQLHLKAQCEMIANDCEAGMAHLRKAHLESSPQLPPKLVDDMVKDAAKKFCSMDRLGPWDKVDRLTGDVKVAWLGEQWEKCVAPHAALVAALDAAGPPPTGISLADIELQGTFKGGTSALLDIGNCLAKLGRCAEGKKTHQDAMRRRGHERDLKEPAYTKGWERQHPQCKGK
ncbi:MAG: hypothetical protein KC731_24170, partial [Myxococcales bacterium]|nr:hypothetical protein [Myxococcales bacterium]